MFWLFVILTVITSNANCYYKKYKPKRQQIKPVLDADFSRLVTKLWSIDRNRFSYGVDYSLSYQGRVPWYNNGRDYSSYPLFSHLNRKLLEKPTYKAFIKLLNNYVKSTGVKERITNSEISENYRFLDLVLQSPVMKTVYSFLKSKHKASPVFSQFKQKLYDLWFRPYYRSSANRIVDSSGFEHVFVGEINPTKQIVTGFHNWIQFYLEEKSKHLDYKGYMKKGSKNHILMMRFEWDHEMKAIGSGFIGTSPEFEMALYSAAFLMGYPQVQFQLNGNKLKITCFGINRNRSIGSCYPDIL